MRKIVVVCGLVLASAFVGAAQEATRFETYAGYVYQRTNSATGIPAFSMNGGAGQFVVNFSNHFGFLMDLGAVHNNNIGGVKLDNTISNYLFGPRVAFRHSRVTPYFQILWGGAHVGNSISLSAVPLPSNPIYLPGAPTIPANTPVTVRAVASQTAFAMTVGGGLDIKISKHVSFRPVQLEYLLTRFQNYRSASDNNQNNLRYSTGLNFTFGGR